MEDVISFLYHCAGILLFCAAITMLLLIQTAEEDAIKSLSNRQATHVLSEEYGR